VTGRSFLQPRRTRPWAFSMVRLPDLAKDRLTVPADRLERFAKGSIVYRVHPAPYSPVGGVIRFNDSDCGNARFSPIRDGAGKIVPTLYAGTTLNCAFMESVFHDVPISTSGPLCLAATTSSRAYEAKQQTPPSAIMATRRSTNVSGTSCCQSPGSVL